MGGAAGVFLGGPRAIEPYVNVAIKDSVACRALPPAQMV
jgi:hypothetical protein